MILKKKNIQFFQQHKFEDCKNILPLLFDFYIESLNLCIEYDGKQHFNEDCHFGKRDKLEERTKRDKIKNQYCKDNKIFLLRISCFLDFKYHEELISTILNNIKDENFIRIKSSTFEKYYDKYKLMLVHPY